MATFTKEIKYISKDFDGTDFIKKTVAKTVEFKELDQSEPDQHKLHFKIISLFTQNNITQSNIDAEKTRLDTDVIYELTVLFVEKMLLIDEKNFTLADKTEFLTGSAGLLQFGLWLMHEKIIPFFLTLTLA